MDLNEALKNISEQEAVFSEIQGMMREIDEDVTKFLKTSYGIYKQYGEESSQAYFFLMICQIKSLILQLIL